MINNDNNNFEELLLNNKLTLSVKDISIIIEALHNLKLEYKQWCDLYNDVKLLHEKIGELYAFGKK